MLFVLDKDEALRKAAQLCSRQEKCRLDMQNKFVQWQVDDHEFAEILDALEREKFIDEKRYALAFVNDKFLYNKWGRIKIAYTLRQKEIPQNYIDLALSEIGQEEYRNLLKQLLVAKYRTIKHGDNFEKKGKLTRFAQSKGFEMDLILNLIDTIL